MSADKLELQFKLLDYHRRAMENRRAIQFRIFLVAAGFILVLTKGLFDSKMIPLKGSHVWLAAVVLFGLAFFFSIFTWAIERWNKHDRDRYIPLENKIWESLEMGALPDDPKELLKGLGKVSWAGWWPALSIWLLAFACWSFIRQ